MPNYSDEKRIEHVGLVRQAMAIKPRATIADIIEMVFKVRGYLLDKDYVWKVRNKVYEERKRRFDMAEVNPRIAEMQDKLQHVQTAMFELLLDPRTSDTARARAGEVIVKAEKTLLEAQMDAGIFERKLGTIDMDEDAGEYQPIVDAMFNLGMITDAEVIDVIPKQIDAPKPTIKKQSKTSGSDPKNKLPKKSSKKRV